MPANRSHRDLHYDQVLTNFSVAIFQESANFVATKVFSAVPVKKSSNKFTVYPKGYFSRSDVDTSVAPETPANRITYGTAKDSYAVDNHALRAYIDDTERADVDAEQDLDFENTHLVTETMLVRREKDFADNFMKPGVWAQDVAGTARTQSSGGELSEIVKWDAASGGGEPIEAVRQLKREMQLRLLGKRPNRMLMSRDVFDTLMDHPDILDRIKGGATTDNPAAVNMRLLAGLFEVDQILVMETVHNTAGDSVIDANTGEPVANIQWIKDKFCFLYYFRPMRNPVKYMATAGGTFVWNSYIPHSNIGGRGAGPWMRSYRADNSILGGYVEARYSYAFKKISTDCGTFISDIVA